MGRLGTVNDPQERGIPGVERRPDGFVLRDVGDTPAAALATMGFAGIFMLIPLVVGIIILFGTRSQGSAFPAVIGFGMAGVFLLVGAAIFTAAFGKLRITRQWEPGELISPIWPVPLGTPVDVRFRRLARRADPTGVDLTGRLVLRESVTFRQGTDTRTVTEDVAVFPLDVTMQLSNAPGVAAAFTVTVPADAPPSFELEHNRLQWWVELEPVADGDDSRFKLWVRPEVTA